LLWKYFFRESVLYFSDWKSQLKLNHCFFSAAFGNKVERILFPYRLTQDHFWNHFFVLHFFLPTLKIEIVMTSVQFSGGSDALKNTISFFFFFFYKKHHLDFRMFWRIKTLFETFAIKSLKTIIKLMFFWSCVID